MIKTITGQPEIKEYYAVGFAPKGDLCRILSIFLFSLSSHAQDLQAKEELILSGTLGNARRRSFHGPGADNTDLAIMKATRLRDRTTLELRGEAFSVFNHSQFFGPASVNGNISSSNFGQIERSTAPRLVQISVRMSF
jgi:hypothetical protein